MNLIDRYVTEVGKHLLLVKGRKDIEKELRSTLEDMLEERAQAAGKPADEAMEIQLLKEYGTPQKVAETYNPNPYLIGPRMFPFFLFVLKIVISVVSVVLLVLTGIKIATLSPMAGPEFVQAVWDGLTGVIGAAIAAFGNIVLVFAILERFVPAAEFKLDEENEWDPSSLKKDPTPDEVKIWEPIFAIVFTFIAISIFNFSPQWLVIFIFSDDKTAFIPALTEAFFRWLPWINIGWVAEIILNGLLLRTGKWTIGTRLFSIGTKLFQIVIIALLLTGPSILAFGPDSLSAMGISDSEAANSLNMLAHRGIQVALGLAIFGTVIEVIKAVYKMVTRK